jgi:hypothetical protein
VTAIRSAGEFTAWPSGLGLRFRFGSLVRGPDLGADFRHGVVIEVGLDGDRLHHLGEIRALPLGTLLGKASKPSASLPAL